MEPVIGCLLHSMELKTVEQNSIADFRLIVSEIAHRSGIPLQNYCKYKTYLNVITSTFVSLKDLGETFVATALFCAVRQHSQSKQQISGKFEG